MTSTQDAQALVLDVLKGVVTEDSHPHVFDDDLLYFGVRNLEANDMAWLKTQLTDDGFDKDARMQVAAMLAGDERKSLLQALGAPPFLL